MLLPTGADKNRWLEFELYFSRSQPYTKYMASVVWRTFNKLSNSDISAETVRLQSMSQITAVNLQPIQRDTSQKSHGKVSPASSDIHESVSPRMYVGACISPRGRSPGLTWNVWAGLPQGLSGYRGRRPCRYGVFSHHDTALG